MDSASKYGGGDRRKLERLKKYTSLGHAPIASKSSAGSSSAEVAPVSEGYTSSFKRVRGNQGPDEYRGCVPEKVENTATAPGLGLQTLSSFVLLRATDNVSPLRKRAPSGLPTGPPTPCHSRLNGQSLLVLAQTTRRPVPPPMTYLHHARMECMLGQFCKHASPANANVVAKPTCMTEDEDVLHRCHDQAFSQPAFSDTHTRH